MTGQPRLRMRPLSAEEFPEYRESFIRDWALDLARVEGLPPEEAIASATRRTDAGLTAGVATPGHYLYAILFDDERVGTLWFSVDEERRGFLDDITILEPFRRRGHGKGALELLEAIARELGLGRLDLHVYRDNPGAIALYERLGYRVTGLKMRKVLGAK